jgi:predicted ferric reductase
MNILSRERAKILFVILFVIAPILLWVLEAGEQFVFTDFYNSMTTVGKITGIVGVCLFAANIFLSGRYTFIDRIFDGLDRVYLFHRKNGIAAFVLLTIHLAAMTIRNWQFGFQYVIDFAFDLSDWPILFGRLGYYGLLVIIFITLFIRLKYERLKFLHSFMGVFLFLGGLHVFLIPSDVVSNLYLRSYILTVVGLALLSWVWRTVLRHWLLNRMKADVIAVNKLGDSVTEVVMKPRSGKVHFIPGQFIWVKFRQDGFLYEDHPFSLTASSEEDTLRISAKALGDFTKILPELKAGAVAEIQGPFGGFNFMRRSQNNKQVWIAGGIGITPFMSMARSLRDRGEREPELKKYDISLFYSVKTDAELIYGKELQEIAQKNPHFKFYPWIAERDGFITAEKISQKTSIKDTDVFICGPKPLLSALSTQFVAIGIPKSDIHYELFKLL